MSNNVKERFKQRVTKLCGPSEFIVDYVQDSCECVDSYVLEAVTDEEVIEDFRVYIEAITGEDVE